MPNKKRSVFWVKLKPYESSAATIRFKPAFLKGLVYAPNADAAKLKAYEEHIELIKSQFPNADLRIVECSKLNADFSISAN